MTNPPGDANCHSMTNRKNIAVVSHDKSIGPAMAGLTDLQRDFVRIFVDHGGRNAAACYRLAYPNCSTEGAAKVNAHKLMHSENVLAAIREEADKRLRTGALLGASVLMEIADNPVHKDQLKAATELLNRAGLIVATQHNVVVEDRRTNNEIIETIARLAMKNNLDVSSLLGNTDDTIDVEYEELSPDGLEDLL